MAASPYIILVHRCHFGVLPEYLSGLGVILGLITVKTPSLNINCPEVA